MTETQHTPGPWTVSDTVKENGNKKISNARHLVAIVGNAERAPQRFEADARLIAESPAMLAALKETQKAPWVHNSAITGDIEALRAICLFYANWNNNVLLPVLAKIDGAA